MPRKKTEKGGKLYGVILAGGVGSRFWPLSRESAPKQLLKIAGEESMLKATIGRLAPLIASNDIFIVTNTKQAELIRTHMGYGEKGGAKELNFILEPYGRNTAPAIGLAALELLSKDPEAVMAVLPADHIVGDEKIFRKALKAASEFATEGRIVTFGIKPSSPETGYGYIKSKKGKAGRRVGYSAREVTRFVEKPNLSRAKRYLKEGGYYWNSGIFVWRADKILEEMRLHLPLLYKRLLEIKGGAALDKVYKRIKPISIDHGILEKIGGALVIDGGFKWSDVGSWSSLKELMRPDKSGNAIKGRVVDIGSKNSLIVSSGRLVATIGLNDMVVIDTPDATLVCPESKVQEVREVVDELKKKGYGEHETHITVERPWGSYTVMETGEGYKIKKIRVLPGRRLSLQKHRFRSERWVVIKGAAKVRRGEEIIKIKTNESTYIPRGVKHRLENTSRSKVLEIIEVQNGSYVGEDDIIRFDDDYERS
jgi:mannose-1-phosphate guanylyltransferase/mannose-6-phosphate isomerase